MRLAALLRCAPLVLGVAALLPVAAESETTEPKKVDLHGVFSQGYLSSSDNNYLNESSEGDAAFTELAFNATMRPAENLLIGAQLFSRNLGELGDFEPVLEWALVDWHPRDWLGLRAGKFKVPYGLYNETSDIDAVRTWVLLPQSIYNLQFRDFLLSTSGLGLYGHVGAGRAGSFDYQLFGGRTSFEDDGSLVRLTDDFLGPTHAVESISSGTNVGAQLIWETPLNGLRAGATLSRYSDVEFRFELTPLGQTLGAPPIPPMLVDDFRFQVVSVEQVAGSWTAAAEYARWKGPYLDTTANVEGYYAQLARRLNSRFEVGGYYSVYHRDKDNPSGAGTAEPHREFQKDFAASLRVDLTRFALLKTEIHRINGVSLTLESDNPAGTEPHWWMFATKVTFFF